MMSSKGADDPIQQIIDEMRKEARAWRGIDPINNRTARQLERFADALTAAQGGAPEQAEPVGVGMWAIQAARYARQQLAPNLGPDDEPTPYEKGLINRRLAATFGAGYRAAFEDIEDVAPSPVLTAGPQQEDMTVAEALERTGFLTLRDLVIEGYEKRGDVLDLANRTTRRYRDKAALTAGLTGEPQPRVICLCGSTRFIDHFAIQTWELERHGHIVLGCTLLPSWYCGVPSHFGEATGTKAQCDALHLLKIDMADEVLVLNIGGYIGESTRNEIAYAEAHGKPVRYLELPPAPASPPPQEADK